MNYLQEKWDCFRELGECGVEVKHYGSRGGRHCEPEASEGEWR